MGYNQVSRILSLPPSEKEDTIHRVEGWTPAGRHRGPAWESRSVKVSAKTWPQPGPRTHHCAGFASSWRNGPLSSFYSEAPMCINTLFLPATPMHKHSGKLETGTREGKEMPGRSMRKPHDGNFELLYKSTIKSEWKWNFPKTEMTENKLSY